MANKINDLHGSLMKKRIKNLGPLHDLLLEACPPHPETGEKSIARMSQLIEMTPQGIYKWIDRGHVPPRKVTKIVELSEGRVTRDDFSAYVFL